MRILFLISFCLLAFSVQVCSQIYDKNCYYGITFDVSANKNWGFGELIITSVEPYSAAEKAGIKVDDIIMEINGKATYLRDNQTIADWLFGDMQNPVVKFTIRNMNTYFKEYTLNRKCITVNSVSEQQLSEIFSFYSLENTNERTFSLQLEIEVRQEVDFTDYHSYDFVDAGKSAPAIDKQITTLLEKELQAKGLVRDTSNPDIVVQAYYSYSPNPKFTGLIENPNVASGLWRYDTNKEKLVLLPVFAADAKGETAAQYVVEYGFSFYDRKYIDAGKLTQIWDCKIKDYLSTRLSLEDYVKFHTPLMLRQFPYSASKTEARYVVSTNRYNYTGMYFDADDLKTVSDIDENSPAYKAGIRSGYIIRSINGYKFEHNKESLSEGYKRFISETMSYRNPSTRFTNADGYADCMFWDTGYYPDIVKEFTKSAYQPHFSYLYNFERYVNDRNDNRIVVEAWDGMQKRIFRVVPEIRKTVIVKTL